MGNKAPGGLKMRHVLGLDQKLQQRCTGEHDPAQGEKGQVDVVQRVQPVAHTSHEVEEVWKC